MRLSGIVFALVYAAILQPAAVKAAGSPRSHSVWKQVSDFRQVPVSFSNGADRLAGTLILPSGAGPFPVVVFVPGSGEQLRDGYKSLPPIWNAFARRGIASFAWDKPGVGESTGNWRSQRPDQRVTETIQAVAAMSRAARVDRTRIGLWGISQAGWAMPPAIVEGKNVAFLISVSGPEGTGHDQEMYRVEQSMAANGYSKADIAEALRFSRARADLLMASKPFTEISALQSWSAEGKAWAKEVGIFDQATYNRLKGPQASPVPFLEKITIPVLAIYGERDTVVNWRESARVYRESLKKAGNKDVSIVTFPAADHSIFPSITGSQDELNAWLDQDYKVFAPGYIDTMANWIELRFVKR